MIGAIPFPSWLKDEIVSIGPLSLRWYGLAYIVGWGLALFYAMRMVKRQELFTGPGPYRGIAKVPGRRVLEDYAFYLLIGIIVGGRLGSAILYNPGKYIGDPLAVLRVWEGGMAFHGGFLGVCAAIWLFARRKDYEVFRMADMAAIGAPFGLLLGRLANFVNQELWGRPTDVPWAFIFQTDPRSLPRHPSQLYEAALEGALLLVILYIAITRFKVLRRPGIASGIFIAGYGAFRLFIEFFREPDAIPQIHEYFTRGMAYSLPMIVVGAAIIVWAAKRKPVEPSFAVDAVEPSE